MSNDKGHFSPTDQDNWTSKSGPPSKVVQKYAGRTKPKWSVPSLFLTEIPEVLG